MQIHSVRSSTSIIFNLISANMIPITFNKGKAYVTKDTITTLCYPSHSLCYWPFLRRWPRCFSYSVWLCGLYYGTLHVLKSSRALCPRVSSFLLALWLPRLGKKELVCALLVHLFVCFVRVSFCHFSLFLGIGGWLRFVIVALPGLFY